MVSADAEKLQTTIVHFLLLLPIVISLVYWVWQRYKKSETEEKCPSCGKLWAAVHLHEKFMGAFQKMYNPPI